MNRLPAIFRIRDFRLLVLTRLFVTMGTQIQAVIVAWQVYQIRPQAILLGLIGLTEALPAIACAFYAGHIVDTHRPAKVYVNCIRALFFNSVALWLFTSKFLAINDDVRLSALFGVVFVSGLVRSFGSPANSSLVPQIVPRELYAASAAWTSSVFQIAAIAGPAIGGLVYGEIGPAWAFGLIPFFSFLGLICVGFLSQSSHAIKNSQPREPFAQSIRAGVKFVYGEKALLSSMALDMFSVLFGGAVAVLPIYADQVLHVGASGLGILRSAPALGSLLVLLWMALRPLRVISGQTLLIVVAGFGFCILGFGISTNYTLSLVLLALSGAFDGVSMVIRQTILQLLTPDQFRGRVSSVSMMFITSSNEIGAFESGFAASIMGLVPSVVFGGTMTLAIVIGTAVWFPELRRTRIEH